MAWDIRLGDQRYDDVMRMVMTRDALEQPRENVDRRWLVGFYSRMIRKWPFDATAGRPSRPASYDKLTVQQRLMLYQALALAIELRNHRVEEWYRQQALLANEAAAVNTSQISASAAISAAKQNTESELMGC